MLSRIIFLIFWFLICFYSMTFLTSVYVPLDNGIKPDNSIFQIFIDFMHQLG